MAKNSFEFKKKIVEEYISGEGGFGLLAKNILSPILLLEIGYMIMKRMVIPLCFFLIKIENTFSNTNFPW